MSVSSVAESCANTSVTTLWEAITVHVKNGTNLMECGTAQVSLGVSDISD